MQPTNWVLSKLFHFCQAKIADGENEWSKQSQIATNSVYIRLYTAYWTCLKWGFFYAAYIHANTTGGREIYSANRIQQHNIQTLKRKITRCYCYCCCSFSISSLTNRFHHFNFVSSFPIWMLAMCWCLSKTNAIEMVFDVYWV